MTEGVVKILGAIPGLELIDLAQPRVGYICNSLAPEGLDREAVREVMVASILGEQPLPLAPPS